MRKMVFDKVCRRSYLELILILLIIRHRVTSAHNHLVRHPLSHLARPTPSYTSLAISSRDTVPSSIVPSSIIPSSSPPSPAIGQLGAPCPSYVESLVHSSAPPAWGPASRVSLAPRAPVFWSRGPVSWGGYSPGGRSFGRSFLRRQASMRHPPRYYITPSVAPQRPRLHDAFRRPHT